MVKFVLWTAIVLVTMMFFAFMTQMGDCPEKVIDPSIGNACTTEKDIWGWGILIVGTAAWVIGGYFIFRQRDRV